MNKPFTLKTFNREYLVRMTRCDGCPYSVYSVFFSGEKLFGSLDRPTIDDCETRRKEAKTKAIKYERRRPVVHRRWAAFP
jgi:hypothetical protein